jgi:hypothetical protein
MTRERADAKLEHAPTPEQIDAGGGLSASRRSATKQKPLPN